MFKSREPHYLFNLLFSFDNLAEASGYFGVSERTIRRWYEKQKYPPMARKLLEQRYAGFSAKNEKWRDWSFCIKTGNLYSPNGDFFNPEILLRFNIHLANSHIEQAKINQLERKLSELENIRTIETKKRLEELALEILNLSASNHQSKQTA